MQDTLTTFSHLKKSRRGHQLWVYSEDLDVNTIVTKEILHDF